jgi:hypothetical protein
MDNHKSFLNGFIVGGITSSLIILGITQLGLHIHSKNQPDPYFPGEFKLYKVSFIDPYTNSL